MIWNLSACIIKYMSLIGAKSHSMIALSIFFTHSAVIYNVTPKEALLPICLFGFTFTSKELVHFLEGPVIGHSKLE